MPALSLRPSSKGVTVLVIVSVVILFGCVLAYVGAAGKLKSATDELEKKEKVVAESKQIALKLETSRLGYFDACSQARYLESSVSSRDYVPTLLKQMEQLGKSVNLRVVGVRPEEAPKSTGERSVTSGAKAAEGNVEGASKEKDAKVAPVNKTKPYDEVKINLEVEGNYMNALNFLHKLTTFPKIIAVDKLDMAPSKDALTLSSPRLTIKMTLTAFILKEDEPAAVEPPSAKSASRPAPKASAAGRYPI